MFDFLQYEFMQKAFLVGIMIAIITPCIGITIVLRRYSMMGDALSHASLAGVTTGLVVGLNPILGAVLFSLLSAFSIEQIRNYFPRYSEIAISIILSAGVGIAGILSGFVGNAANLNSFLFGSIVAITDFELYLVVCLSIVVLCTVVLLYKELFYISFDEESARLSGVPIKSVNFIFMLVTAITISVSARTVGTLIISSLMVLPVACAMQVAKSYKQSIIASIIFALWFTISGLFISFYMDLKPGGTIVLIGVFTLIIVLLYKNIFNK